MKSMMMPLLILAILVDELTAHADVVEAEQHQRFRRLPVAAGAADLLVVGLGAAGQIEVADEADVRFVDPHAEGDRCDDDQPVLGLEPPLDVAPPLGVEPGMIGDSLVPRAPKRLGQRFGLGTGGRVDDARQPLARRGEVEDLTAKARWMFGRSKPRRKLRGALPAKSLVTISARVSSSAVAVKAASGTPSADLRSPIRR